MKRLLIAWLMIIGLIGGPVFGEGVFPDIPKASGEPHPEGNEFWRVNHPRLLRHDRDLTLREGEREITASLASCVACHSVNGPDSKPVSYESGEYFCRVCHDYAAVRIDCFQCHNSLPPELSEGAMLFNDPVDDGMATLLAYLEGVK